MTTYYISGPITGQPDHNRSAFTTAAREIRHRGHDAINPHDLIADTTLPWHTYLRHDLAVMLQSADAVVLLPGAHNSRGSRLEFSVACAVDIPVYPNLDALLTELDGAQ